METTEVEAATRLVPKSSNLLIRYVSVLGILEKAEWRRVVACQ